MTGEVQIMVAPEVGPWRPLARDFSEAIRRSCRYGVYNELFVTKVNIYRGNRTPIVKFYNACVPTTGHPPKQVIKAKHNFTFYAYFPRGIHQRAKLVWHTRCVPPPRLRGY